MSSRGLHRRPTPAQLLDQARAQTQRLTAELARERELRCLADALMGRLVEDRADALEYAGRLRDRGVLEHEQLQRSRDLVAALRRQAARPHPTGATERTQPIPVVVPLGSPHWRHAQDLADQRPATSWARRTA